MKKSTTKGRSAKPLQVSPLIANYVAALNPAGKQLPVPEGSVVNASPRQRERVLRVTRSWKGVTVHRYTDGFEVVWADGRKVSAASLWSLALQMLKGAK